MLTLLVTLVCDSITSAHIPAPNVPDGRTFTQDSAKKHDVFEYYGSMENFRNRLKNDYDISCINYHGDTGMAKTIEIGTCYSDNGDLFKIYLYTETVFANLYSYAYASDDGTGKRTYVFVSEKSNWMIFTKSLRLAGSIQSSLGVNYLD